VQDLSFLSCKVAKAFSNSASQEKEIKALIGIVKEQAAQLRKVSAQLEASKPGPQMVANEQ
jgi:hypothetical protein